MNKENLNKMADHLDGDGGSELNMRQFCNCVVGRSLRVIEHMKGNWNHQWVAGATERMFGIPDERWSPLWMFLFGGDWPNDPHLAAVRLRYVAQHGDAPSKDQWDRFRNVQAPAVAEVDEPEYKAEHEEACA